LVVSSGLFVYAIFLYRQQIYTLPLPICFISFILTFFLGLSFYTQKLLIFKNEMLNIALGSIIVIYSLAILLSLLEIFFKFLKERKTKKENESYSYE
jgi:hypothetical protein